jgi:hypothetical protein
LLFAPGFLVTTICFDILVPEKLRKWTVTAWILSAISCTILVLLCFSQIAVLGPSNLKCDTFTLNKILFRKPFGLALVQYYCYFFICAAAFALAFPFRTRKTGSSCHILILNGFLLLL